MFISCDGYWYGGKSFSLSKKLSSIIPELKPELTLIQSLLGTGITDLSHIEQELHTLETFIEPYASRKIQFEKLAFDHPLFILFSSGTTGIPKCIVHSHGGVLLNLTKEHLLHCDIKPGDRVFYFTTCGWMMWNWLVTALSSRATLILFEGSPFFNGPKSLFEFAEQEQFSIFGTSAKYIDAVRNSGFIPKDHYNLETVKLICSTGSPLGTRKFSIRL